MLFRSNDIGFKVRDKVVSPEEVGAAVLAKLKKVAEDYLPIEALSKAPKSNKKREPQLEHIYKALFGVNLNLSNGQSLQLSIDKITEGDLTLFINDERIGCVKDVNNIQTFTLPNSLLKTKYNKIEIKMTKVDEMVQLSRDQLNLSIRLSSRSKSETVLRPGYKWNYQKRIDITEPGLLFREMLQPLLNLRFHQILIYQGDSNLGDTTQYRALLVNWIKELQASFTKTKIIFFGLRNIDSYNPDQSHANQIRSIQRQVIAAHKNIRFIDTSDLEFRDNSSAIAARYFQ